MDSVERAQFQAYADGVNAYIAQHSKTLPLEFRFLTYAPHVWTVEDSVLVGLSMTEFLNHGYYKEESAEGESAGQTGSRTDRGAVREFFLARSSSGIRGRVAGERIACPERLPTRKNRCPPGVKGEKAGAQQGSGTPARSSR